MRKLRLTWEQDGDIWRLWCDDRRNHAVILPQKQGCLWRIFTTCLWRDPGGAYHLVTLEDLEAIDLGDRTRYMPSGPVVEGCEPSLNAAQRTATALVHFARAEFLKSEITGGRQCPIPTL